mgnify:CR=1 FL=1
MFLTTLSVILAGVVRGSKAARKRRCLATVLNSSFADNHNIYETIEQLQKDIKTLEKAVYSGSTNFNLISENINQDSYGQTLYLNRIITDNDSKYYPCTLSHITVMEVGA